MNEFMRKAPEVVKGLSCCKKSTRLAPKVQNGTQRVLNLCKIVEGCKFYKLYESLIAFTKSGAKHKS